MASSNTSQKAHHSSTRLGYGACRPVTDFEKNNRIGKGTYGTVYKGVDRSTGETVALKRIILHHEKQLGFPITSLREARLLRRLSHPNCVTLREIAVGSERDGVFLVFEYCEHDMATLLQYHRRGFSESEVKGLMRQLLQAIDYIHSLWIIHRDLKMSNLLYNSQGLLKLADFGLAREYGEPLPLMTPKVVTLAYRAPELLLGGLEYGPEIDIWAAGCIFAELCLRQPLMAEQTEAAQVDRIFRTLGTPTERQWPGVGRMPHVANGTFNLRRMDYPPSDMRRTLSAYSADASDFLLTLLQYNPAGRPSAEDALHAFYFRRRPYPQKSELMPSFPSRHEMEQSPTSTRKRARNS